MPTKFRVALLSALQAVRVVDAHDGRVSLTSCLLGAAGAGVVAAPSWPGVVALLVAAGLYGHKKMLNHATQQTDETLKRLATDLARAGERLNQVDRLTEITTRLDNRTKHMASR